MISALPTPEQRLPLRKRQDLVCLPQREGMDQRWAVKDPVKLDYYHLGPQEMYLLDQLDGTLSLPELKRRFEARFAPRRVSLLELQEFLRRLHQMELVTSDADNQGRLLFRRKQGQFRAAIRQVLLNPLAIRLPGIDAGAVLRRLDPLAHVLFHGATLAMALILAAIAVGLLLARWDMVRDSVVDLAHTVQGGGFVGLLVTLGIVKVLHELGHGMACRRFGGECHEIGAMLLVGTPCLYCNVSDAWMFSSRWRRIVVSLAGVYVELLVALLAVAVWLVTLPGPLHTGAWYVVVVCSFSTVLVNANPLLRYDGYYVLADWTGIPNLAEQSRTALWSPLERCLSGRRSPAPLDGSPAFLIGYGLLSTAFRIFITVLIVWTLYGWFSRQHVRAVGDVLVLSVASGMALPWGYAMMRWVRAMQSGRAFLWTRWLVLMVTLTALIVAVTCVPVTRRVRAPAIVESAGAVYLRAPYEGRVIDGVSEGTEVTRGQTVIVLENLQLLREVEQAEGEYRLWHSRLATLERRASVDAGAANQVTAAAAAAEAAQQRWSALQEKLRRMKVVAPVDGLVMAGPRVPDTGTSDDQLPRWTGSPLDPKNRGCSLRAGELICLVGSPDRREVLVPIRQSDIDLIRQDAPVVLYLDQCPGQPFSGRVHEISEGQIPVLSTEDDPHAGSQGARAADDPLIHAEATHYARIRFTGESPRASHGSRGLAKIEARADSIGARFVRYLRQNLTFQLP